MISQTFLSRRGLRFSPVKTQSGFTLIEIMVVVVILGILASLIVPRLVSRPDEARIVKAQQDIRAVQSALEMYRLDNGFYPSQEQGLLALVTRPTTAPEPRSWSEEGYLPSLPKDPWGNDYQYANPGTHSRIDIFSYGPTGQPGGEVIGNWQ